MADSNEILEEITRFICTTYNSLPKKGKPDESKKEWTTLSAIVETANQANPEVVALATGTKCLGRNELSQTGELLSDSHAEILARRSFQRYLYGQLQQAVLQENESILEQIDPGRFQLKPQYQFHLYVSHVPCGDAAIFTSPDESSATFNSDDSCNPPETKKLKVETNYRTGAKLVNNATRYEEIQAQGLCRTKPGKGDPTLSMSCSDKISKWNLLGLQGNLLSLFIPEKIIFASIIIGGSQPFNLSSVRRGLYHRYSHHIPADQHPIVYQASTNFMCFPSDGGKPAPASIICYLSSGSTKLSAEVSVDGRRQGVTKKNFSKPSARVSICRLNMALLFLETAKLLGSSGPDLLSLPPNPNYADLKALNKRYILQWESLRSSTLSGWTEKPASTKTFSLDLCL